MIERKKFYIEPKIPDDIDFNFFYLFFSSWDDYGNKTSYSLYYRNIYEKIDRPIGNVKIMHNDIDNTSEILPSSFDSLPFQEYCSLGQDLDYYWTLKEMFPEDYESILYSLNDAAFFPGVKDKFEYHERFIYSLLRNSEAEKAFWEAAKLLNYEEVYSNFDFGYSTLIGEASKPHEVYFNFHSKSDVPNRIISLIGKNGTGKTHLLANLAMDLSGNTSKQGNKEIAFSPSRPLFSKVIAISYSIFDKFSRPEPSHSFSYKYCGLKTKDNGILKEEEVNSKLRNAFKIIRQKNRETDWIEIVGNLIGWDITKEISQNIFLELNDDFIDGLSSGQSFIIYVFTEVIANIKKNSLLIFDEPEMHLHPNAISNLIRSLDKLIQKYDSYAVIATHSPIIIQEIPSEYVKVVNREGKVPYIHNLNLESFGESVEILTQEVFQTKDVEDNYKVYFKKMSKEFTFKEILLKFNNRLSLSAKSYLLSLYENPAKELE